MITQLGLRTVSGLAVADLEAWIVQCQVQLQEVFAVECGARREQDRAPLAPQSGFTVPVQVVRRPKTVYFHLISI